MSAHLQLTHPFPRVPTLSHLRLPHPQSTPTLPSCPSPGGWLTAYPEPASTAPLSADTVILYSAAPPVSSAASPVNSAAAPVNSAAAPAPAHLPPLVIDAAACGAALHALPAPCASGPRVVTEHSEISPELA